MTKKITSFILIFIMLFSFMVPVFAEKQTDKAAENTKVSDTTKSEEKETASGFDHTDAASAALSAAKSKFIIDGLSSEMAEKSIVTKLSYNKDEKIYTAVVRSGYKHKYTCTVAVNTVFGKELGFVNDGEYSTQNIISAFFCQQFEKLSYFFFKKFH